MSVYGDSQACLPIFFLRVDVRFDFIEAERAHFTVRGCLGLLKSIQSVALIVFGRDLAMKVLVTQSSVLSFVFATC